MGFYWVKGCVAETLGQELREGSVFYMGEKANFFLNFLRSLRLEMSRDLPINSIYEAFLNKT